MAKQSPMQYMLDAARGLAENDALMEDDKATVRHWLQEYERWEAEREALDVVAARRERQAATVLALVFVGIPVYTYHWPTIRKELGRMILVGGNGD